MYVKQRVVVCEAVAAGGEADAGVGRGTAAPGSWTSPRGGGWGEGRWKAMVLHVRVCDQGYALVAGTQRSRASA